MDNNPIIVAYDVPIEVTEQQLTAILANCRGGVAYRVDETNKKCFIKVWSTDCIKPIEKFLNGRQ